MKVDIYVFDFQDEIIEKNEYELKKYAYSMIERGVLPFVSYNTYIKNTKCVNHYLDKHIDLLNKLIMEMYLEDNDCLDYFVMFRFEDRITKEVVNKLYW